MFSFLLYPERKKGLFIKGILTLFNKNIVHRDATFLSKSIRTCPLSGMPHGSLVHAQIERSCEIINGIFDLDSPFVLLLA